MLNFLTSKDSVVSREKIMNASVMGQRQMRHALFDSGKQLKSTANEEILHGKKSGRIYKVRSRSGRVRRHRSSAPGETHANLTGATRRSLSWKVRGHKQLTFGYGIVRGDAPVYARRLEKGGGKLAARPTLANSLQANRRNIQNNLERRAEHIFK